MQPAPCPGGDLSRYPAPAAVLQDDRPLDGTTRYDMTVQQPHDSVPTPFGTMTVTQATSRCGGNDVVRRVIVYDYGARGRVVARGSLAHTGAVRTIHDSLTPPAFNSTDLELVVRSLALKYGMSATLEIYDPEFGGARPDSITVLQLDPARIPGAEGSWVVRSLDRRLESTYRISERSRTLLSADIRADTTRYHIIDASRAHRTAQAIPVMLPGSPALRQPALVSPDTQFRMRARLRARGQALRSSNAAGEILIGARRARCS